MLNFFDNGLRHGAAADYVAKVLGNLLNGFGGSVGEEKDRLLGHLRTPGQI
jgi:hypothetical protein